ncbi:unnamed protein product [Echinostoma caproni]|uniref:Rab-GAP TBC domain-containing protein n=1 Tax=Echinostoma caproni TaxID=27848 RepID=A0A183AZJ9_9TREM|nr:unnamed protein product [Echinostoma caproni]
MSDHIKAFAGGFHGLSTVLFMEESMCSTVDYMQLIFALLGYLRPKLIEKLELVGLGPDFALAWIVTWFAHVLPEMADVRRLFDLFLATDPLMLIYVSVAVIIRSDEEVHSTSDDFGMLHHILLRLPKKHPVEELVKFAVKLYIAVPPEKLTELGNQRQALLSSNMSSRQMKPVRSRNRTPSVYLSAFLLALAAFVDLDADRQMDAILLDASGYKLYASLAPPRQSIFSFNQPKNPSLPEPTLLLDPAFSKPIRVVSPADFNGDSIADLLLLTGSITGPFDAYIAYGASGDKRGTFLQPKLLTTFSAQPLVCDINSDLIADIYGEVPNNSRVLYYGG